MKKAITYLIFTMLIMATFAFVVPKGLAEHTAKVEWKDIHTIYPASTQVILDPQTISTHWPDLYTDYWNTPENRTQFWLGKQVRPLVFIVNNTMGDAVTLVEVFIPQSFNGYAYFYLNDTKVTRDDLLTPATEWSAATIDPDPHREVRAVRFSSNIGIAAGNIRAFWLFFRGGPEHCTYEFTVRTTDNGSPSKSSSRLLRVVMDDFAPIIHSFKPANGATVDGLPLPCGNHYFSIDITAYDNTTCSSGIKGAVYSVLVLNATTGQKIWNASWFASGKIQNETDSNYKNYYFSKNDTWIAHFEVKAYDTATKLPGGYYNISVTVKDRVGNAKTEVHKMKYVPPPIPEFTASPNTWIKNPTTGLVESQQVVYKNKILGSSVTLTDTGFKSNTKVEFRIYIPTYISYNFTYHTFNILVNSTTAKADGSATATFIFPKAPQGTYTVSIIGVDPAGTPLTKYKTVAVVCEIIFNPNEVIGPAVIDVEATGLHHPARESPLPTTYLLIREQSWANPKDAIMGINQHIPYNWYIDYNGTLQNWITKTTGVKVEPGFSMPILQPGTYEITLLVQGEFYYWQCITWGQPLTYTSQTNTIKVVSTLDLLPTINQKLDELKPIITEIRDNVVTIKTTVGTINATLEQLKPVITSIDRNVVTINTTVGTIKGTITTIKDDVAYIKTNEGWDVRVNTKDLGGVTQAANDAKQAAEGLTIPVYLAVIFSLIAVIIAAICAVLVYRKIA